MTKIYNGKYGDVLRNAIVSKGLFYQRIHHGYSPEIAANTPNQGMGGVKNFIKFNKKFYNYYKDLGNVNYKIFIYRVYGKYNMFWSIIMEENKKI